LRDDPITYGYGYFRIDKRAANMASMKKMKPNPKEKRKQDQKQNQGTICTTATIIHLLKNLQQQHIWDSPTKHIVPFLQSNIPWATHFALIWQSVTASAI
jgi:hypothetical protein